MDGYIDKTEGNNQTFAERCLSGIEKKKKDTFSILLTRFVHGGH
jgi:hypothetical protein